VGRAIAGIFYYFDWTLFGLVESDDATSVQLHNALFESIFTTSGPMANQTLADMYAAEYLNPSTKRYKTVLGDKAGYWTAEGLKLPMPADPLDPNFDASVDAFVNSVVDVGIGIFLFTCPLEVAQAVGRKLYAFNASGVGYMVILAPHLVTPLLWQSDPNLYAFFRGAIGLKIQSFGDVSFAFDYQSAFGQLPGLVFSCLFW
jgi:hypothetical protein